MKEREITLPEMLDARERRRDRQTALLEQYRCPLICFTMNIAGPVKNSDFILRGFQYGNRQLQEQLSDSGLVPRHFDEYIEATGNEAFYVLDADLLTLKRLTTELEDNSPIGRLFDMDVLDADGQKVDRSVLGLDGRKCLLCGNPAKECASRRIHSVEELQKKTASLLWETVVQEDSEKIAELACKSLLFEVATTPKPGLVDRFNNGSHRDMDIFTFLSSTSALWPYFAQCAKIGMETANLAPSETFRHLRWAGKRAEHTMKYATGGVNTHKGAIFSMGVLCGAAGRLGRETWPDTTSVLDECAAITAGLTQRDFQAASSQTAQTVGQKLFFRYGITGVRGQVEQGFPAVRNVGLPKLEEGLRQGLSLNDAGCGTLLALIAADTDTNLIARGGRDVQLEVSAQLAELLKRDPFPRWETLESLDRTFIEKNLSPGGSADLLSVTYFLHFLQQA